MDCYIWNRMDKILKNIRGLKKKKTKNVPNCDNCQYRRDKIDNIEKDITKKDVKEEIAKLIKENEKYFVSEITARTRDVILHRGPDYIVDLKMYGYCFSIAADIFEKYGVFFFVNDLYRSIHAPEQVQIEVGRLVHEHGIEKIAGEIALYMKENYSEKFGISIISRM